MSDAKPTFDLGALIGVTLSPEEIEKFKSKSAKTKAEAKSKDLHELHKHSFAPPVATPPRGPDQQTSTKEITHTTRLKQDIEFFRHKLRSAEARELFLHNILEA